MLVWYVVDEQENAATIDENTAYFVTASAAHNFCRDIQIHHDVKAHVADPISIPDNVRLGIVSKISAHHYEPLDNSYLAGADKRPTYTKSALVRQEGALNFTYAE